MRDFEREYKRLNAAQKQAVDTIDGPVLVIAGPGTGKTQLLSLRVANILRNTDSQASNILCLSFTEAAARNTRERLAQLIGDEAYHVASHTFHSFGSEIIGRYPEYFVDAPLLRPIDELGTYELFHNIFSQLPHNNPFSQTVGGEFLYLTSVQAAISWLKQAGIEAADARVIAKANLAFLDFAQPLVEPVFTDPPRTTLMPKYKKLLRTLRSYKSRSDSSLATLVMTSLAEAIERVQANGRYARPITEWRNQWLIQNHFKKWGFADRKRSQQLVALAAVYEQFQQALAEQGVFTFDDMILRSIRALEQHDDLRLALQEQYQYILVDEYQDTNGAQNHLLELLADNPVNEDRPNLMVVGDDDQAIYRFQGAYVSIMLDFVQRWREVKQIVLTENYRSAQALLDVARFVITQGGERLENQLPTLTKSLTAHRSERLKTVVARPQTLSELDQYQYVTREIGQLIHGGIKPSQIAVLAPKHRYLQEVVPHLIDAGIAVNYERREHILEQPRIVELLDMARLIKAAAEGDWEQANSLLPTVLAADYWEIKPSLLWQLSLEAFRSHQLWLELLQRHKLPMLRSLAGVIITLAKTSLTTPVELFLDQLMGNAPVQLENGTTWASPYRQYYFNEKRLQTAPEDYLKLLGQLTTLRNSLKQYRPERRLTVSDLIEFIELYEHSHLTLLDTNPHTTSSEAVELMTAYKAKGLEWEAVFVLGCHNEIWGSKARGATYSFSLPNNLRWIKPARDSLDDRLRLFYVAITRAKSHLYLIGFKQTLSGRPTEKLAWLLGEHSNLPAVTDVPSATTKTVIHEHEVHWQSDTIQKGSLKEALRPFVETYQLSATHLNDFLDITRGGPRRFLLRHVLHFPESMPSSAIFGSAMHGTLHFIHATKSQTGKLPNLSDLNRVFTDSLGTALTDLDFHRLHERGLAALKAYMHSRHGVFLADDKSEYDFKSEGVVIDDIRLTGKIDVLRPTDDGLVIIDYKTGRPMETWRPRYSGYAPLRAHFYQQQLAFYHLLVAGSAHFGTKSTAHNSVVQFVEPTEQGDFITLEHLATEVEKQRLIELVKAVWQHIMQLNFPDTSRYSLDLKGLLAFEEDLLNGTI